MRTYELDGRLLGGESEAAQAHLAQALPLPAHYGRNLDALWDCLTEMTEETTLCIAHVDAMTVTTEGTLLLQTLSDAAAENPRLHIRWVGRVDAQEGDALPPPRPRALLVNGSPHREGNTHAALRAVERALLEAGMETEIVWLGTTALRACTACGACAGKGLCVHDEDIVNTLIEKARAADALVFGTPAHFAGMTGQLAAAMNRMFSAGRPFDGKVAAGVCVARRAGCLTALDQMQHFFTGTGMITVSSPCYWGQAFGGAPGEAARDAEGMQALQTLGERVAYVAACLSAGREAGLRPPAIPEKARMNFIRD